MSLGDTYLQLGQLEKAEKYLKKVLASKDDYTQSGAYNYLYLLEKSVLIMLGHLPIRKNLIHC